MLSPFKEMREECVKQVGETSKRPIGHLVLGVPLGNKDAKKWCHKNQLIALCHFV
jgi:hypothetical protein